MIGAVLVFTSLFTMPGCGNETDDFESEAASAPYVAPAQDTTKPASTGVAPTAVTDAIRPAASPVPQVGSVALNPKHGQPGHRCDIQVGQPLNSKPAAAAPAPIFNPATASAPAAQPVPTLNVPTLGSTSALNPAHGQPGHRCDIQVGQPLNSKPAQTSVAKPAASAPISPFPSLTPSNSSVATGLNPAHGQPGHRCDIKVGEPLNSKPQR